MELFSTLEVEFSYFDILSDKDVREGLKTFGEWPTYPQVLNTLRSLLYTRLVYCGVVSFYQQSNSNIQIAEIFDITE